MFTFGFSLGWGVTWVESLMLLWWCIDLGFLFLCVLFSTGDLWLVRLIHIISILISVYNSMLNGFSFRLFVYVLYICTFS